MEEGDGGKQAVYGLSGVILEDGCPGTGMRRPGGPLHSIPAFVRKSILSKSMKSGLVIETKEGYKATQLGVKLLAS
jgi:hypothetical protein